MVENILLGSLIPLRRAANVVTSARKQSHIWMLPEMKPSLLRHSLLFFWIAVVLGLLNLLMHFEHK